MTIQIARTLELSDLETSQERREVVAYAAVFDTPTEIRDHEGHYWESISRSAFNVTIRDNPQGVRAMVNHGRDIYGQPSDRFALPYGTVVSMEPDGRGLLTVTRVAETPLGDEVLELLRSGGLSGFSFSGRALQTTTIDPVRRSDLPTLVRTEIALREFGPAVFQAYDAAQLVAVRSGQPLPISDGEPSSDRSSSSPDDAPAESSAPSRSEQEHDSPQDAAVREPNAAHLWLRDRLREETDR